MHGVKLNDGRLVTGESWEDVESNWNRTFMNAIVAPAEWREELATRAKNWTNTEIAVDGSARDFLHECERAGLCTVVADTRNAGDDPKPKVPTARLVFLAAIAARVANRAAKSAAKG